jgi:hypothetical protein
MMWVITCNKSRLGPAVIALGGDRVRQKPGKAAEAFFCIADNPLNNEFSCPIK